MPIKFALMLMALLAACVPITTSMPEPNILVETTTETPQPSATFTPSVTPTPTPHLISIEYLRSREYPASELLIEETLEVGPNYFRYIASYMSDGLKQYGLLTVPFGEKPETGWPVIIFNHGFIPPEVYQTTERYVAYVDGFARSGYIVFRPDYRGHANSEGQARGAYGRPDYVIDVLNAVSGAFSFELALDVRAVGQLAELYIYDGDDHNISQNFSGAILRSIEFFDVHVKGGTADAQ